MNHIKPNLGEFRPIFTKTTQVWNSQNMHSKPQRSHNKNNIHVYTPRCSRFISHRVPLSFFSCEFSRAQHFFLSKGVEEKIHEKKSFGWVKMWKFRSTSGWVKFSVKNWGCCLFCKLSCNPLGGERHFDGEKPLGDERPPEMEFVLLSGGGANYQ